MFRFSFTIDPETRAVIHEAATTVNRLLDFLADRDRAQAQVDALTKELRDSTAVVQKELDEEKGPQNGTTKH